VSSTPFGGDAAAARARDWHRGLQAAVCDVVEPWAHGTIMRATRYPSYWDFNLVRVEEDPVMSVASLAAFADEALAGLQHRRVDFDLADAAEPLRAGFAELGWRSERLVSMRHESPPPPGPGVQVEEVPYDAVSDLRTAWHEEDFPGVELGSYPEQAREVAALRRAQVLAVREGGTPVAFAELERDGSTAEITQVYVHPDHRGQGRGTAMTRAAMEAAGDTRDLWIVADDEDRPKELYARLGFRPVWRMTQFLRLP
jgi:ribosomal protein S18 acetylase RimI-like enzyme